MTARQLANRAVLRRAVVIPGKLVAAGNDLTGAVPTLSHSMKRFDHWLNLTNGRVKS